MNVKELFKDAMPVIEKSAPVLGGMLGGPIGLVMGNVIPLLANAFETHPANLQDLVQAIIKDPHAEAKLKSVQDVHADWLSSLMDNVNALESAEISIKLKWQTDDKAA